MAARRKQPASPPEQRTSEYWQIHADRARAAMESADAAGRAALLAVAHAYEVIAKHSRPKTAGGPLIDQLAEQARQRVELGKEHIRKQRKIVARLKRDEHDTYAAERLLTTFEETQVLHKEHADRLSREAAAAKRRKPRARR